MEQLNVAGLLTRIGSASISENQRSKLRLVLSRRRSGGSCSEKI